MKYSCTKTNCNYSTNDKSNFNKHMKSSTHLPINKYNHKIVIENPKQYVCDCDKIFTCKQHLSRHRLHNCEKTKTNIENQVIILTNKIENYETINKHLLIQNENMSKLLMEYVKNTNSTITNNNNKIINTYNISIKNYLQQNYPNAPALNGITDYSKLKYDTEYDDFIDALVYNHNNSYLKKYLGDFIIYNYKKNNPSTQSVWSSDISRLTYIIKELLANNESTWNHDYKGIKIKKYIIDPLLKYIKEYIDEYWIKNLDLFKTVDIEQLNKFNKTYTTIYQIKKDIDGDILGNDIVKYIAPQFYMDKTNVINNDDNQINNEYISHFIDN